VTRVVTFGEIMLRLSPPGYERLFQSPELRVHFGGSEANVAVGVAHLGVESEYVTVLPPNALGDAALRALRAEGVGTRHVVRRGTRMGLYFVEPGVELRAKRVVYDRAGSALCEVDAETFDWTGILGPDSWFHWTGITPALSEGAAACTVAAVRAARDLGASVSVDLNWRPALWGARDPSPLMRALMPCVDVLIGNLWAAGAMLGARAPAGMAEPEAVRVLAAELAQAYGCRIVALTRREHVTESEHGWSAALYDARSDVLFTSRRYQVRLVDRVGGGDSFAAALIYALTAGRELAHALAFATAASALKLTISGDFNDVTADEVDRLLSGSP